MKKLLSTAMDFMHKYEKFVYAGIILVMLLFPLIGVNVYILRIIIMIGIYSVLALGLNLITGFTGQVSLGNAAFYAIGAYTSAILTTKFEAPFFVAFLFAGVVAACFGFLIGLPTMRLSGTYLAIVTLGLGEIVRILLLNLSSITNGPLGISKIPRPSFFGIELTLYNYGIYYLVFVFVAVILLFCYLIIYSKVGRSFIAIREDELAATLMGIKTAKYKILAFSLSAMLSGLAGSFYSSLVGYIDPNTFIFDTSILILSIVIFGGMGSLKGMIIGAALLIIFPEALRSFAQFRFIIYGLILVMIMRYRPQGLMGGQSKYKYKLPFNL